MNCQRCKREIHNNAYYDVWLAPGNCRLVCFRTDSLLNAVHFIIGSDLRYEKMSKYVGMFLCYACVGAVESKCLEGIPLEDLPLLINVKWITEEGTLAYKRRLADGK